ncbi:MAG: SIMPL domain-containing protein [Candidatus Peregrinibacteria bacterium]
MENDCCKPHHAHAWILLVTVILAAGAYLVGKEIEVRGYTPVTVNVDAEGKVTAVPDIAELQFGVQTARQKSAQAAMTELKTKMNAVVDAVKAQGIEAKDITTQSLSLLPVFDYTDGKQVPQGFEASQSLVVKVRKLDSIGDILNIAVAKGSNQIGSVSFTIDNPTLLRSQARTLAITQAKIKAQALASELGMSLGKIKGFSEGSAGYPPVPMYRNTMMKSDMAGAVAESVPVPTGEQEIAVNVTVTYELR